MTIQLGFSMAMLNYQRVIITLWLFNIAMENGTFIDGLPIKNCNFPSVRADLLFLCNMQLNVLNDLARAQRPCTEKKALHVRASSVPTLYAC